ncbi:hypothetical protein N0M98_09685 [Paenibacillus doosanensis]|uniref:hypothetical protein n=1 Tax=Paenibacillus doosanensis TaxID=1229154 RepID=UPI00217F3983|nr:hypothetical protein [Paenibacillus doosanensis]MCS7460412.1 hypothetical protein [Paenibacillus doosanensis]
MMNADTNSKLPVALENCLNSAVETHIAFLIFVEAMSRLTEGMQKRELEREHKNRLFHCLDQFVILYMQKTEAYFTLLDSRGNGSDTVTKAFFLLYAKKMKQKLDDLKKLFANIDRLRYLSEQGASAPRPSPPWLSPLLTYKLPAGKYRITSSWHRRQLTAQTDGGLP